LANISAALHCAIAPGIANLALNFFCPEADATKRMRSLSQSVLLASAQFSSFVSISSWCQVDEYEKETMA
jgi:hypothetical protein